jgi:hypothetical protein
MVLPNVAFMYCSHYIALIIGKAISNLNYFYL